MIKPLRVLILTTAALLVAVSMLASVLLWVSLPGTLVGQVLAGVTAVALESGKYIFLPLAVVRSRSASSVRAWASVIGLGVFGGVLLIVSVAATVGFLEAAYSRQQQTALRETLAYQTLHNKLDALQQQAATLQTLAQHDAEHGYRQRGYEGIGNTRDIEAERDRTLEALASLQASPQGEMDGLIRTLAPALGADVDTVRHGLFVLLAVLVDLAGVVLLSLATGATARCDGETPVATSVATPRNNRNNPETPPATSTSARSLADRIIAGEFGAQPTVRGVMDGADLRHGAAQAGFLDLVARGLARRVGRKFVIKQTSEREP